MQLIEKNEQTNEENQFYVTKERIPNLFAKKTHGNITEKCCSTVFFLAKAYSQSKLPLQKQHGKISLSRIFICLGDIAKPNCSYRNSFETSFRKTLFWSKDIVKEAALIETANCNLQYAIQRAIYSTPCNAQSILRHAMRNLYATP